MEKRKGRFDLIFVSVQHCPCSREVYLSIADNVQENKTGIIFHKKMVGSGDKSPDYWTVLNSY